MSLKRLRASAPVSTMLAALDEDGGFVAEGIFPRTTISCAFTSRCGSPRPWPQGWKTGYGPCRNW